MENSNNAFLNWCTSFSGCDDGGDIGSPQRPSVWICGIEPGGCLDYKDHNAVSLLFQEYYPTPATGSETCKILNTRFGRQTAKLLGVLEGYRVDEYKKYSETHQPYTKGKQGYFKWNLYPIPFKNIKPENWNFTLAKITGFSTKNAYINWIHENRFPFIRIQTLKHKPKLIVCFGITKKNDFKSAFLEKNSTLEEETIEGKKIYYHRDNSTLLTIIPFPSGPYGLNKNYDIEKFGNYIKNLLINKTKNDQKP